MIIQHTVINAVENDPAKLKAIQRWLNSRDDRNLFTMGPVMTNGYVTISLVASGSGLGKSTENAMLDVRRDFTSLLDGLRVWYAVTAFGELGLGASFAGEKVGELSDPN